MADVEVSYKGNKIVELSESGTKVLKTSGKYCENDLTIDYNPQFIYRKADVITGANTVRNAEELQKYLINLAGFGDASDWDYIFVHRVIDGSESYQYNEWGCVKSFPAYIWNGVTIKTGAQGLRYRNGWLSTEANLNFDALLTENNTWTVEVGRFI